MKKNISMFLCFALSIILVTTSSCGKQKKAAPYLVSETAIKDVVLNKFATTKDDAQEERNSHVSQARALEDENHYFRRSVEKWCAQCTNKVNIQDAQTCPSCGDDLISKKLCRRCGSSFTPNVAFKFCPYCRGGVALISL